jgi:transcriptional regulator with GAF, ATPase, and Fis domain
MTPKLCTLLAIRGPLAGARITLTAEATRFGRATSSEIAVPDATVSRTHAVIRRRGHAYMLEDCGSASGTLVNGRPLAVPHALAPNDEIVIGQSVFLFDSEFDLQNADFTDNSVFLSSANEDTMMLDPVATLEPRPRHASENQQGVELLTELGDLFDSSRIPFGEALRSTTERMARLLAADVALLMLHDQGSRNLRASAAVARGDVLADNAIIQKVFNERKALLVSDKSERRLYPVPGAPEQPSRRSVVAAPLLVDDACLGMVYFERQELDAYTLKDLRLVQSLGRLMAVFIEARQRAQVMALKGNFTAVDSRVLGGSPPFKRTLELIRRVADSPVSVLLIGETGTGKEVLAAEIHRLSEVGRQARPFVVLNCAAIPESLFEAELFGYEKGAFTGAVRMKQGQVELAHGGTLFLDEIGELSLALQPKLLRFLQEHTFMRVGGTRSLRSDVRLIAATNRNLEKEVEFGRFREDLFHRLNAFPITVPSLRERREDVRLLAEHFAQVSAKSLRREILGISDEAVVQLEKYHWPGNIRELANTIERAVLLSDGKVLLPRNFQFPGKGPSDTAQRPPVLVPPSRAHEFRPLEAIEKEYILEVLRSADGNQVRASEILGIHRNTLRKKLAEWGVAGS